MQITDQVLTGTTDYLFWSQRRDDNSSDSRKSEMYIRVLAYEAMLEYSHHGCTNFPHALQAMSNSWQNT